MPTRPWFPPLTPDPPPPPKIIRERPPIRHLTGVDIEQCLDLDREAYEADCWDRDTFVQLQHTSWAKAYVWERHGRVLGFIYFVSQPGQLTLLRLAVERRWRRQGIGRELLAKLTAYLHPVTLTEADAVVSDLLTEGHKMLSRCGWVASREIVTDATAGGRDGYRFTIQYEGA